MSCIESRDYKDEQGTIRMSKVEEGESEMDEYQQIMDGIRECEEDILRISKQLYEKTERLAYLIRKRKVEEEGESENE